jgi:hypothetical protein
VPGLSHRLDCGSGTIGALDPDNDPVFLARKGYYRRPVMAALTEPPQEPMAIIAAEHTAQLNAPQNQDIFFCISVAVANNALLRKWRSAAIPPCGPTTGLRRRELIVGNYPMR